MRRKLSRRKLSIGPARVALYVALSVSLSVILATGLTGCGGGRDTSPPAPSPTSPAASGGGRATFTIRWPPETPASRLIPKAAKSLVVDVYYRESGYYGQYGDELIIASKTAPREPGKETAEVSFDNLPTNRIMIRARALPTTDGTGIALAQGFQVLTIKEDETAKIALTLGSTVSTIKLALSGTGKDAPPLMALRYRQLTATAYNDRGEVVLLSPDKLEWTSLNPDVGTVSPTGLVTTLKDGPLNIVCRDTEADKSGTIGVYVVPESNAPVLFNPFSHEFTPALIPDDFVANGDSYRFDTDAATLTDTTTGRQVAQGKLVTRNYGTRSVTYAVFPFRGNVRIGGGSVVTGRGANPVVLLSRGDFTLDGDARIDFSANGDTPGPGGFAVAQGPGRGIVQGLTRGGGSGTGAGGAPTRGGYYGFAEGGSGGAVTGAGGGSLYIAAQSLALRDTFIGANGGGTFDDPNTLTGGGGGTIILWSAQPVTLTRTTLMANGGTGSGERDGWRNSAGGGGYVTVGYPRTASRPTGPYRLRALGGQVVSPPGEWGASGRDDFLPFDGF